MKLNKIDLIGISLGVLLIAGAIVLRNTEFFFFLIGLGIIISISPFVLSVVNSNIESTEKEEMFLEFARNLVESVKVGTPISKSIINVRDKPYGVLSKHVKKLANQIAMGIPLGKALQVFSSDIQNKNISRAITLIGQAEKAGGDIGEILESVAGAVSMSDKLKKERRAVIQTLVVQGYIIFFVFIIIVLIMQFRIVPIISNISSVGAIGIGSGATSSSDLSPDTLSTSFLYLLLVQGFFSGLAVGKLAEGTLKAGVKHSFALMILSFLSSTGANIFFS